jgi:putative ABC transport system permease protein
MRLDDLFELSMANLWRTKLRTILTTLGVTIGIGALVSMVSFGTGMQKNVTDAFKQNDLFTSIQVTPKKIDVEEAMSGNIESAVQALEEETAPLDKNALEKIKTLNGVEIAFPEIRFPVKLRMGDSETQTTLRALPSAMKQYKPYSQIPYGSFFKTDNEESVIISQEVLRNLKIRLREETDKRRITLEDTLKGMETLAVDSILGRDIEIITSVVDVSSMLRNPLSHMSSRIKTPFTERFTNLRISGIMEKRSGFESGYLTGGILLPIETADKIPHLDFNSVWSLLERMGKSSGYSSLYVRLKSMNNLDSVRTEIEDMGFGVFSIADQLEEIKKGFIILDTALGTVGTIALIVAALGIINTMVMSILERRREIGIMKAIGGSENEIKGIFFVEAASIGIIGGLCGLALGWVVTRIAGLIANGYIIKQGGNPVQLFYIPLWLIIGALGFSILVSLLAGLYPAIRAARVDPVEALRHD